LAPEEDLEVAMGEAMKCLEFLIGKWKGRAEGQFGEKGVIDSVFECSHEPSEMFIAMIGESRSNGKQVNKSAAYLTWDPNVNKYVRKSMFSYGWINNEVGDLHGDRLTFNVISMDCEPDYFKGLKWRSFIHKYSQNEIGTGLEVSKNGEPFRLYGESKARRVQ
jgi:hypothetical protein